MGTVTGNVVRELRGTGRGSDYYGGCDQCGKNMSECFVSQAKREYRRDNGELYYAPIGGGAYGHKECLEKYFGPHVESSNTELTGRQRPAQEER